MLSSLNEGTLPQILMKGKLFAMRKRNSEQLLTYSIDGTSLAEREIANHEKGETRNSVRNFRSTAPHVLAMSCPSCSLLRAGQRMRLDAFPGSQSGPTRHMRRSGHHSCRWISSRSVHVSFWSLFSLGSRLRKDARRSSTLPASGSTATVPMRARLFFLLTFPARSTRSIGRLCCDLFVFIAPSLAPCQDSVLFTGSTTAASQVISSARGVQQGDPLGPVLFALAIHPIILEARAVTETMYPGGIDACSFHLDDGFCAGSVPAVRHFLSALIRDFRRIGLEVWTRPKSFLHALPPSRLLLATFRVVFGLGPPISNFWEILWGLRVGVWTCLASASVRPGLS